MPVNWGMAGQGNNALAYFQLGQQLGQQVIDRKVSNAVGNVLTRGLPQPGQTPGIGDGVNNPNGEDWQTIARYNPELAMQLRQREAQTQAMQRKEQRARVEDIAKLFQGVTPENYGQRIAAARTLGVDVSGVPQTFDPNWVAQNGAIFQALAGKDQELSGIARELQDAGYKPGTPEFNDAMRGVINNKYASEYVDENGNTRRRSALNLSGPPAAPAQQAAPPPSQAVEPMTPEQFKGAINGLGQSGALQFLQRNGMRVRVSTPEEAMSLPSGTPLYLPDGTVGVRP